MKATKHRRIIASDYARFTVELASIASVSRYRVQRIPFSGIGIATSSTFKYRYAVPLFNDDKYRTSIVFFMQFADRFCDHLLNLAYPLADYRCQLLVDKLIMQEKPREEMQNAF
jgi:hypothetical protein